MKRVLILGGPGSGKSTLANALGKKLKLPVVHLDQLFWTPGWVMQDGKIFASRVGEVAKGAGWVIEGNYLSTLPVRMNFADTIIVLNMPTFICFWRVLKRSFMSFGRVRSDMADGCAERFDLEFLSYVWNYKRDKYPDLLNAISGFKGDIHFLDTRREIVDFFNRI